MGFDSVWTAESVLCSYCPASSYPAFQRLEFAPLGRDEDQKRAEAFRQEVRWRVEMRICSSLCLASRIKI